MESPQALRPARAPAADAGVVIARAAVPFGPLNKFFYVEVGRGHHWVDRLTWDEGGWQRYAADPKLETWLVWEHGTPAGYAELWKLPRGRWHLAMFGLLPPFRGRGLGGHLLTRVAEHAWREAAARVTLDTCELDGPHALANYRARGFEVVRQTVEARGRE
jgi:ribosomal protein S18 acetylase RimI-like enzyme